MNRAQLAVALMCGAAWLLVAAPAVAFAQRAKVAGPEELVQAVTLTAAEAFEKGLGSTTVQLDPATGNVTLYDTMLFEDDGAGSGGNAKWVNEDEHSPDVTVDAATQFKKVLMVDRPAAAAAVLYVRPGQATLLFNGHEVSASGSDKFFKVPAEWVKQGANEVIIRAEGDTSVGLKMSRRQHIVENNPELQGRPPLSFKSADGGKTWEPLEGELCCRLNLRQYPAEGSFTSPVIDLARVEKDPLGLTAITVQGLTLTPQADLPAGAAVELAVRFGAGSVVEPAGWTDWLALGAEMPKDRRYVQWRATLKTGDPKVTPVLKSVKLEAKVTRSVMPAWAARTLLRGYNNERILYTSMPFEYEDANHPRLQALRDKYQLDQVVAPARTELEKLVLLRDWVARQWRFDAPEGHYPAWDADEILTRKTGMCVQYAITYIQVCAALGYPARYVCGYHQGTMGTAHEVSEVWSNEYRKWIFMDPTTSRNEFCADPKTGIPLSMTEVHERMLKHYYGDQVASYDQRPAKFGRWCDTIALVRGRTVTPNQMLDASDPLPRDWPSWTKWFQLCYVPRNNWYARPAPLPRLQGWNNWDWTGFWSRYDPQTPRDLRYARFSNRRSDVEWTINQVSFTARYGEAPNTVEVQMATVTPNFETYLVSFDGKEWAKSADKTTWTIHEGLNRLSMRVHNTSGVLGPESFIELELPRPAPTDKVVETGST